MGRNKWDDKFKCTKLFWKTFKNFKNKVEDP